MMTSNDVHRSQIGSVKAQYPNTSYMAEKGITKAATSKSDNANDTISRFDGVCKRFTKATAIHTRELPMIVPIIKIPNASDINTCCHTRKDGGGGDANVVVAGVTLLPFVVTSYTVVYSPLSLTLLLL